MSHTDKLREIAFKWGCRTIPSHDFTDDKYEDKSKELLSDLTALISEHYVEKEKYDEAVRQRDELKRMLNSLILSICAHPDYVSGEEGDEWHDLTSLAEASIKSTESI